MSRPDSLRDDLGFWLCAALVVLCPPIWIIGMGVFLWNLPETIRQMRSERDCKRRGHHLWGEYQDHPYHDIPHRYCQHCHHGDPESYCYAGQP